MKCLTCGYWQATHGMQCESCAMGDTGAPDEASAQRDAQYDQFCYDAQEQQRIAEQGPDNVTFPWHAIHEQLCVIADLLRLNKGPDG